MNVTRKIGAIIIAAAAIVIWLTMAPRSASAGAADPKASASAIDLIMADDTLNQARTEGAPQQAVVNGWSARDLLEVLARQGADRSETLTQQGGETGVDNRPAALLVLAVLGVALMLFTSSNARPRDMNPEIKDASVIPAI